MTEYECTEGHKFAARSGPKRCPYCPDGVACKGKVTVAATGAAARINVCEGTGQDGVFDGRKGTTKAKCPVCGKRIAATKAGKLRTHGTVKTRPHAEVIETINRMLEGE